MDSKGKVKSITAGTNWSDKLPKIGPMSEADMQKK
jgi:hypothetical protein